MGSDAGAVVSSTLAVNGVSGLSVVDASVMPRLISRQHQRPDHYDRRESRRPDALDAAGSAGRVTVEPFTIPEHADEAAWVRSRVEDYRFFEEPAGHGWSAGVNRAYMEALRAYWLDHFDWPAAVARLNRHSHVRVRGSSPGIAFTPSTAVPPARTRAHC